MGTLVDSDIDSFIRGHKAKLQQERQQINQYTDRQPQPQGRQQPPSPSNRKQWDKGQRSQPAVQGRPPAQPEETGLKFGDGEQQRRQQQLKSERQQEYNNLQSQRQQVLEKEYRREQQEEQRIAAERDREGLAFHESNRQKLSEERQKEYQEYLAKQQQQQNQRHPQPNPGPSNYRNVTSAPQRGQFDDAEQSRQYNEPSWQYNDYQYDNQRDLPEKPQQGSNRQVDVLQGSGAALPVGEYSDERKQQLYNERQREYNEQQQQKLNTGRDKGLPPKPPTPNHFFKNIGQHDRTAQILNEERKKEYNQKLAEDRSRKLGRGPDPSEEYGGGLPLKGADSAEVKLGKDYATLPGLHYTNSAEGRKIKTRNAEYNEFLREKQWKDAHRLDNKKPPNSITGRHSEPSSPKGKNKKDVYGTLPGLHYSDSAEQGKGKKGWATPTYDEILEQQRREEAFRRNEDDYGSSNMRRHASEGAINNLQNDYRSHELDKEFEARKVRFDDERHQQGGILDDDNWLQPERREEQYQQLVEPPPRKVQDDMALRVGQPNYLASLPVGGAPGLGAGHDDTNSAKRRKQSDYRRELQLQMEESKAARKREKVQGLRVNASGLVDPEKSSYRVQGLEGPVGVSPRREYKANEVQPYHTKFLLDDSGDDLRLDLGGGGGVGRERGRRRDRDNGLGLDPGFAGLLESRRNVGIANPPPGLIYQPSFHSTDTDRRTYVTGGPGGLANPYSSVDEAYHFYGMKNPLDVEPGNGNGGGFGGGIPGYNPNFDGPPVRGSPTPRVTFADDPPSTRRRDRSKERISPYQFPSDDDLRTRSRTDTQSYGAELERQIQEKKRQKELEKQERERYERKLEEDIKNYNPFGRGGGGAPIKDETGNAIADLRSLQRGTYQSPRQPPPRQLSPEYSPRHQPRDDLIGPPPAQQTALGENTYARGGHGIFGQPKTEAEKDQSDKYKDDLRQQIAEKRRREQMEKERERMEEEKENKRLEDQRIRMQTEYEEEQKKIRAREEEARRKNEELKKQAEDRKKEQERKRREADDARMKEQQEQIDREKREQQTSDDRERVAASPPLPAQRRGRDSPSAVSIRSHRSQQPSPAQEPSTSNRPNSSDVLTQLASMRKQLQSERRRVENALENSKNEPDVFDPRTIQRPPPNKLIFENAVNKKASLPPPTAGQSDLASARNIQQFNELKFKADTDSRRAFRSMFPDAPVTNTTLEAQQDAMIRQQEEQLRSLRDRNVYDPTPSNLSYGRRPGNISARSQLASNSAFIDVEGVNHFPEDFEDMAGARNDSARERRRNRADYSPRPPSGMGSQASLDVERIQRKNEERLRRLNNMANTGDDISMGDPDDILDRFMAKQRYNRPPSGQTLQDDSWLRPGSKVV